MEKKIDDAKLGKISGGAEHLAPKDGADHTTSGSGGLGTVPGGGGQQKPESQGFPGGNSNLSE